MVVAMTCTTTRSFHVTVTGDECIVHLFGAVWCDDGADSVTDSSCFIGKLILSYCCIVIDVFQLRRKDDCEHLVSTGVTSNEDEAREGKGRQGKDVRLILNYTLHTFDF